MGAIHERITTTSQLLAIPGTAHATFTGAPLWLPSVLSLVGSLGRTEDHRIISEATLGFLDGELRGQPTDHQGCFFTYGDEIVYEESERAVIRRKAYPGY